MFLRILCMILTFGFGASNIHADGLKRTSRTLSLKSVTPDLFLDNAMADLLALHFANMAYIPIETNIENKGKKGAPEITSGEVNTQRPNFTLEALMSRDMEVSNHALKSDQRMSTYLPHKYFDLSNWQVRLIDGETGLGISTRSNVSAVVAYHKKENLLIVAFRGTVTGRDVVTDASLTGRPVRRAYEDLPFYLTTPENLRFPKGFAQYFRSMAQGVFDAIREFVPSSNAPKTNVVITGHSLGGTAANLAMGAFMALSDYEAFRDVSKDKNKTAKDLAANLKKYAGVKTKVSKDDFANWSAHEKLPPMKFNAKHFFLRTFGMPTNAGNQQFIDWLENRGLDIVHYRNINDPVVAISSSPLGKLARGVSRYNQGISKHFVPFQGTRELSIFKGQAHMVNIYGRSLVNYGLHKDFYNGLILTNKREKKHLESASSKKLIAGKGARRGLTASR